MSNYKPLSDAQLAEVGLGAQQWNRGLLNLVEQCRRANRLAEVLQKYHYSAAFTDRADMALSEALANYLGEDSL